MVISSFFVFIPPLQVSLCLLTRSYYSPLHFASSWSVHCPRSVYMLKYHIQVYGAKLTWCLFRWMIVIVGWHNSALLAPIRSSVNSVLQFHVWDLFWLFWFGSGFLPALDFLITHKYVVCVCGLVWLGPQSQSHQTVATLKCEGFKHSLSDAILFEDNTLKLHFDIFLFSSARFL